MDKCTKNYYSISKRDESIMVWVRDLLFNVTTVALSNMAAQNSMNLANRPEPTLLNKLVTGF